MTKHEVADQNQTSLANKKFVCIPVQAIPKADAAGGLGDAQGFSHVAGDVRVKLTCGLGGGLVFTWR